MVKEKRQFSLAGNNKGLWCPFKPIFCQEDRLECNRCQIYIDWRKQEETIVICYWCDKVKSRKRNPGQLAVYYGVCLECQEKYLGVKAKGRTNKEGIGTELRMNQKKSYGFKQRVKVWLFGRCYLRHEKREGWTGSLPIYLAKCPEHGYFEDYPHGYRERLDCPKCLEERYEGNRE